MPVLKGKLEPSYWKNWDFLKDSCLEFVSLYDDSTFLLKNQGKLMIAVQTNTKLNYDNR
jgi:hypothetical protein